MCASRTPSCPRSAPLALRILIALTVAAPAGVASPIAAYAQAAAKQAALEPMRIRTQSGDHLFSVEVMRTDPERERGLMYRRFLPADRGMLFDFKSEQSVAMWMKNTYIPLDMVFISRAGVVVNIAENAEPLSERIIPSNAPSYAVLELNAGIARSIGLKRGDRVEQAMFNK